MVQEVGVYSKDYADGISAPVEQIDAQIEKIFLMDAEQMLHSPYIGESRASIFVAACVIFRTIYQTLQLTDLTASLNGAQEAIIEDLRQQWQN